MEGYEHCYSHRADRSEERKRNASKGGKAGGNGRPAPPSERVERIDADLEADIAQVRSGTLEAHRGAVCIQGHNARLRAIEVSRKIRELEEVEARLADLEERADANGSSARARGNPWAR